MAEEVTTEEVVEEVAAAVETPEVEAPEAEAPEAPDGSALMGDATDVAVDYTNVELPEGIQMDTEALTEYGPVLKEAGVTEEQAKALFPIVSQMQAKQADAFNAYRDTQTAAIKAMPAEDMSNAKRAVVAFTEGDAEATAALNSYKGDEAWLVRILSKVGKAMGEDKFIDGKSVGSKIATEDALFPSMAK